MGCQQCLYPPWNPPGRKDQRRKPCYLMAAQCAHHCTLTSISRNTALGVRNDTQFTIQAMEWPPRKRKGTYDSSVIPLKSLSDCIGLLMQCSLVKRYKSLASNGVISADSRKWPNTDVEWNSWHLESHQHYLGYGPVNHFVSTVLSNYTDDNNKVYWSL